VTKWVIRIAVVLALIAAAAALVAGINGWIDGIRKDGFQAGDKAGAARVQARWDEDRAQAQAQRIADADAAARETLRRLNRQQENEHAQASHLARVRADRDAARAERDGLQLTASAYLDAAGCGALRGDSALECVRKAAAQVVDVLGRCTSRHLDLAEAADDARARGLKCEADYDSLTLKASMP
jgi:hypothetical protein